jgi:hypothetical protein
MRNEIKEMKRWEEKDSRGKGNTRFYPRRFPIVIRGSALRPTGSVAAEALRAGDGLDNENLARSVLRRREEEGSEERDTGRQLSCC